MRKCIRCNGEGRIPMYEHYNNGICYNCDGCGYLFDTKEEKEEFNCVAHLFDADENAKVDPEYYFSLPDKEREKLKDSLWEIASLIECSKLDIASESGYDSYEEYEEAMKWEHLEDDY